MSSVTFEYHRNVWKKHMRSTRELYNVICKHMEKTTIRQQMPGIRLDGIKRVQANTKMLGKSSGFNFAYTFLTINRLCFINALNIYESGSDRSFRIGEIARTSFKLAETLLALGDFETAEEYSSKYQRLRRSIVGTLDSYADSEQAFDQLVSLWSR
jgi:hypothetical protein